MTAETTLPTYDVQLIAGLPDEIGETKKTAKIAPMTTNTLKKLAAIKTRRGATAKTLETLFMDCVLEIGGKKPNSEDLARMLMCDRDVLMVEIRVASRGKIQEVNIKCTECEHLSLLRQDVTELERYPISGDMKSDGKGNYTFDLTLSDYGLSSTFRLPTGLDIARAMRAGEENPMDMQIELLTRCCIKWDGIDGPFGPEMFDNMTTGVLGDLIDAFQSRLPGVDMQPEISCHICGATFNVDIGGEDFLFRKPKGRKKH